MTLTTHVRGSGPSVVLLPSLGRSGTDFAHLAECLADHGYQAVALDLHGVRSSPPPGPDATLHDLAGDVAKVIRDLDRTPVHVVGHAFGNRVARCLAADHPELVRSVTLLAAGGKVPPAADVQRAMGRALDMTLPAAERRDALSVAMFAARNDPDAWVEGWWPDAARAQSRAGQRTPVADWWTAGSAPVLIVQGLDDVVAPPENGRLLAAEIGRRAQLVELEGAGHAMVPERPAEIAQALLDFITRLEDDT